MRSPMPTAGPQKPLIWGFRPLQTIFLQMKKPRNPLDYEVSVRAGDGNRTHISSLEGWCSTTELHLHLFHNSKVNFTQQPYCCQQNF